MRTSVHHLIEQAAGVVGPAAALTFKDVTLSYAQLWAEVQQFGAGLAEIGVDRGDRVAVFLEKRPETVISIFGAAVAGSVFVPINPLLRPQQVAYILDDCRVRVLVTSAERWALLRNDVLNCKSLEYVVVVPSRAPVPVETDGPTFCAWAELSQSANAGRIKNTIDTDIAAILYTSGSTGSPKGVVLTHRNLIVGAESVSQYLGNTQQDVILAALPLSFDAGFSQLTTAFSVGAHVVLLNYLLPGDVVRLCAKHRITGMTCVPPLWIQIADQSWPADVAGRLRYFANTGGRMPRAVLDKLRAHFPDARPYLMYGLTEAFRSTYLDPAEVDRRPDSIGKAIPNAEVLVVRPDGTLCDPGEPGELVHRGALVALGYWNDPERTAARFRPAPGRSDSWRLPEVAVWSGDSVVRDDEGFLYFVGRNDEMIKTSGYRVSPSEVEEVVYQTGLVRDVVAMGVADPNLGQRIVLVASAANPGGLDGEHLLADLKRTLPGYMLPSRVVVVEDVPKSPNGKLDRARVREELTS